jgi:hypothetical protein
MIVLVPRTERGLVLRGIVATVSVGVLAALVLATAASSAGPPTSGITAGCTVGGLTVVSGFKGNPSRIDVDWSSTTDDYSNRFADPLVGGKYGHEWSFPTPTEGFGPSPYYTRNPDWTPDTFDYSVYYKGVVAYSDTVTCSS